MPKHSCASSQKGGSCLFDRQEARWRGNIGVGAHRTSPPCLNLGYCRSSGGLVGFNAAKQAHFKSAGGFLTRFLLLLRSLTSVSSVCAGASLHLLPVLSRILPSSRFSAQARRRLIRLCVSLTLRIVRNLRAISQHPHFESQTLSWATCSRRVP